MKKIGIVYGSSTGTCESLAGVLASKLGVAASDVLSAGSLTVEKTGSYDVLFLGSSTWGDGELQDDWYSALEVLKVADLSGKQLAIFGCGDASCYPDTFCGAMGIIYNALKDTGATFIGTGVPTDGYDFSGSEAVVDGTFVGLPIDEMNEGEKTDARLNAWLAALRPELA